MVQKLYVRDDATTSVSVLDQRFASLHVFGVKISENLCDWDLKSKDRGEHRNAQNAQMLTLGLKSVNRQKVSNGGNAFIFQCVFPRLRLLDL